MSFKRTLIIIIIFFTGLGAVTKLGKAYVVFRNDSPYVAADGDMSLTTLPINTKVRLIKDESMAEMVLWAPVRIVKLMFTIKPHGNWLVEDEKGNRGYMWDSDLQLIDNK